MRNAPYDVLDTTPTTATPDTLFVPFFWPDEPDRYGTTTPNQDMTTSAYSGAPDTRYNSNHGSNYTDTSSNTYNYTYHNNYLGDKRNVPNGTSRPAYAQAGQSG